MKNPGVILRCMQMLRMQQFFLESCHCQILLLAICSSLVLQHVQSVTTSDSPLLKWHWFLLPSLSPTSCRPLSAHFLGYLRNPWIPWPSFMLLLLSHFSRVRPHRQQPTRLPRPWDSPGKNTGVDCHFLLQCMKVKSESEKWKWSRSVVSDP